LIGVTVLCILGLVTVIAYEKHYVGKIYPAVSVGGISFAGLTPKNVEDYWLAQNTPFTTAAFEFRFENEIATISAQDLDAGFDATLSATQAYMVGRSAHMFTNMRIRYALHKVDLAPLFRYDTQALQDTLTNLASRIDVPTQDALFQFENGKVVAFKPSHSGRQVNREKTTVAFLEALHTIPVSHQSTIVIPLTVDPLEPSVTTEKANTLGIRQLIGRGYSEFTGSIPGRIHNVAFAAEKFNGVLMQPGETFSFVKALGEVSAATGYQAAYIIKDGRTVLGDGGGVCQVSTTLFRAAMDAGLPIVERHGHAYRVHYYEEGGYKPGIDATIFSPSVDLKLTNDTPGNILIQTKTDTDKLTLIFELYGTSDGRTSQIYNQKIWDQSPPPPDLYQDDPTLAKGVIKQVDFAAWGARTSFQYKVTRNGETLIDTVFPTNFRPWQAVYLRGTKE
jgi:vancomycin resistance protein YoaR